MKAIGIDLGTTNSAAAYCRPGAREPKILSTRAGDNLTPSVVMFRRSRRDPGQGDTLVGKAALNQAKSAPEDAIFSIKRLMGRTYDEPKVAEVREKFNYTIVPSSGEDPGLCVRLGDKDYTPTEISVLILRQIKEDAEKAMGDEVTHAVITVPAYFEERQRAATRKAGELAGLKVKKIIDEPTAAAIAFGVQSPPGERHRILVYDLGGGTFDISILQMVKDEQGRDQVQVLQIEGDNWLGGDDFDGAIVAKILDWVKTQYQTDLSGDKKFCLLAKQHAEAAKRELSEATEAEVVIPAAVKSYGTMVDVELVITREEFESAILLHVNRTMELVRKALREQSLTPEDISDVLLVGGSTLIPLVYGVVENFFDRGKVKRTINPMECVALGAGILATTLTGVECPKPDCHTLNDDVATECVKCGGSLAAARSVGDTGVTEVTARSLGIAAVKGDQKDVFVPIIPKGTPYPLKEPKKEIFRPTSGRLIRVPVLEGDDPVASKNEEQGFVEYQLPEEIDASANVEVSFNYDRNRQLTVTVRVQGTTFSKTETLRRDLPRSVVPAAPVQEEEEPWLEELERTISFLSEHFLKQYGQYMDPNQLRRIESDLARAQQLLYFPDEVEGRRQLRVLQMHIFNSGLASQIYLAERVTESAAPEVSQRINKAVAEVRQAHTTGDTNRVQAITNALRITVAQAMSQRADIKELADRDDFDGLLRTLQ